jgi:RIO kinase 1
MSSEHPFLNKKQLKKIDSTMQRILSRIGTDRKTMDEVFDTSTLLSIEKLISNRTIDYIDFPISTGKEGNVFLGITPQETSVAVKIFRISTATFKHINQYLEGDPRFQSIHKSRRDITYAWTSKEWKNLQILQDIGVRAPIPIKKNNNVLVMEFIGSDRQAAPLLKNVDPQNPKKIFSDIIKMIEKMYVKASLIHGDLSPYNILYYDHKPYLIDLGQGVLKEHPNADIFLRRDIHNIISYFNKYKNDADEQEIYENITGKKWVR